MGLFARRQGVEERSASFQSVWGTGGEWSPTSHRYDPMAALGLWSVVACVRHRANLIGQLPMVAYREDVDGFAVRAPLQPDLLVSPSGTVTRASWMFQMSISRDVFGNAFGAVIARDGAGHPKQVEWLNPTQVHCVQQSPGAAPQFFVNGRAFPTYDMLVVPSTFILGGSPLGVAPLFYAGLVDLGRRAQEFGADWFRNGAVPSSIIYADAELTNEQANNIRDRVTKSWQRRQPGVLGAGLKLEHVKVAANESQFTDTIAAPANAVAAVFNVPGEEVGVSVGGSALTYANRTEAKQAALDRMNGDLVAIQEQFAAVTGAPSVKFTTGAYLRSDTKSRYEAHAMALAAGFLTVDEVRDLEERRPIVEEPVVVQSELSPRALAEVIQKIYLGVGVVIADGEAREILNRGGAGLTGLGPMEAQP